MRVALAGAGMVSRHHLIAWSRAPDAQVVAVCDPDAARAEARTAEFGIPARFTDAAAMLDAAQPDALDVAAPVGAHAALVRLTDARGIPVLCQKPLCPTLDEARQPVTDVRVRLMAHENWRFRPHYREARAWLAEGQAGPVVQAGLAYQSAGLLTGHPALVRQPFMATMPRLLVFETLVHHLDVLRCLLGPLRVEGAVLTNRAGATVGEDTAAILLSTGGDVPVTCTGTMAGFGAPPLGRDQLEVVGSAGRITFDGTRLVLGDAVQERNPAVTYQAGYDGAIRHFAESLASGAPFETWGEDNLETLALMDAVYSAVSAGTSVQPWSRR